MLQWSMAIPALPVFVPAVVLAVVFSFKTWRTKSQLKAW